MALFYHILRVLDFSSIIYTVSRCHREFQFSYSVGRTPNYMQSLPSLLERVGRGREGGMKRELERGERGGGLGIGLERSGEERES